MTLPPLPESFNEIYLKELRALRPGAFADATATPFVPVETSEGEREANERGRARNLADLFERAHGRPHTSAPDDASTVGAREPGLAALCLSGGGIRSATFNLGVIQGLARNGVLRHFDYLSSVSGGGYIAGWLKAWMHRAGTDAVIKELARAGDPSPTLSPDAETSTGPRRDPLAPEPRALDRLREYSNYLTPKVGLLSPDSWTAGALVVRNLILNWLVLVPLLAAVITIPQAAVLLVQAQPSPAKRQAVVLVALLLGLIGSLSVHWMRRPHLDGTRTGQKKIVTGVVLPIYLAAAALALGAAWVPWAWWSGTTLLGGVEPGAATRRAWLLDVTAFAAIWTVFIPLAGWSTTELVARASRRRAARGRSFWWEIAALILSGVIAGALLVAVAYFGLCGAACGGSAYLLDRPILFVIVALPALLFDYLIGRTLFVAIAGLGEEKNRADAKPGDHKMAAVLDDFDREWWARLSGWVLALSLGWLIFSSLVLLGGYLLHSYVSSYAPDIIAAMGGAAGIVTAILARSSDTSSGRGTNTGSMSTVKNVALKLAAPVFIIVLVAYLALGTAALGRKITGEPNLLRYPKDSAALVTARVDTLAVAPPVTTADSAGTGVKRRRSMLDSLAVREDAPVTPRTFFMFLGFVPVLLVLVAVVFSRVVNVNRFSMHGLYRNRLVRAFLGASNVNRVPDPFTGFATTDNVKLHELWRTGPADGLTGRCDRPLTVINTTLNLVTGSKRLAWQMRKAESFSMTPFHCGNFHEGYRPSATYGGRGGISLGTAMTISGAAANPNMGYHSSPTLGFLMTLLNARLGAWLGNTNEAGRKVYDRSGPRMALNPLLSELLGWTDSEHAYINLSDGGHFDNLGLYEMVLRRCRNILVVDAGRDPSAGFQDLGNAIRKIRIDFGIPIEFREIQIVPREKHDASLFCATGQIIYSEIDGPKAPVGQLVYLKPALYGKGEPIPYDVFAYSRTSMDFPHESTSDQWFDEAQFESYRALGMHAVKQVSGSQRFDGDFEQFLQAIRSYIRAEAASAPPEAPRA